LAFGDLENLSLTHDVKIVVKKKLKNVNALVAELVDAQASGACALVAELVDAHGSGPCV
jgi:hypothetical protein